MVKKKLNVYDPLLRWLRERNLLDYCAFDRTQIKKMIKLAIERAKFFFITILLIQLIYQSTIVFLILTSKLLLLGQYSSTIQELSFRSLFKLPESIKLDDKEQFSGARLKFRRIQKNDLTLPIFLNQLFLVLWITFLVTLIIYFFLMLIRAIQYCRFSFRVKTILKYARNTDPITLSFLCASIGVYHLMYKIASEITPFYFNIMLDETVYIKTFENEIKLDTNSDFKENFKEDFKGDFKEDEKCNGNKLNDLIHINNHHNSIANPLYCETELNNQTSSIIQMPNDKNQQSASTSKNHQMNNQTNLQIIN